MSKIVKIVRPIYNGMYRDTYDVQYIREDGGFFWKTYTIRGEMIQKHFDFIMAHSSTPVYSLRSLRHTMDVWKR